MTVAAFLCMRTGELVSVREYLSTSYRPDCDYVDGVVLERNVGERDHAELQTAIAAFFFLRRKQLGIWAATEMRVQVSSARFRVPDVCVVAGARPEEQILTTPPFICVEILSKDDRMGEMEVRAKDYLSFGVPYVFILNPKTRTAWRWTTAGMAEVTELRTENPEIVVPLDELFA